MAYGLGRGRAKVGARLEIRDQIDVLLIHVSFGAELAGSTPATAVYLVLVLGCMVVSNYVTYIYLNIHVHVLSVSLSRCGCACACKAGSERATAGLAIQMNAGALALRWRWRWRPSTSQFLLACNPRPPVRVHYKYFYQVVGTRTFSLRQ